MHVRSNRRQLFRRCLCCNQPAAPPLAMHRRKFLTGLAAVGLAGTGLTARATTGRRLIDVHNHVIPPFYLAENRDRIDVSLSRLAGLDAAAIHPRDGPARCRDRGPPLWFGNAETARSTARRVNDYCVGLAGKHPGRFGLFGAIPLPDIEGSLREIEYALDVLKADGIGLLTSYGGKWLGDADYQPVPSEGRNGGPVAADGDVVIEPLEFVVDALRKPFGEIFWAILGHPAGDHRHRTARMAEDETDIFAARQRAGEQQAHDRPCGVLLHLRDDGRGAGHQGPAATGNGGMHEDRGLATVEFIDMSPFMALCGHDWSS